MRNLIAAFALLFALFAVPASALTGGPALFNSEQKAQAHCPNDVVVWLNIPTGVLHSKGQRWYGRTKNGAFVCQGEALRAGDRGTRNGQ